MTYTIRLPNAGQLLLEAAVATAGTAVHYPLQLAYELQMWLTGEDLDMQCPSKVACEAPQR